MFGKYIGTKQLIYNELHKKYSMADGVFFKQKLLKFCFNTYIYYNNKLHTFIYNIVY